ncbi:MAG: ACP S-malonyltransferase [Actinobacteria bacterium]|nr:ACP S-malonyltransferase [Actinomycetota bacterium]
MGADLLRSLHFQQRYMKTATRILSYDPLEVICDDKGDALNRTLYAQPALFLVEVAVYIEIVSARMTPDLMIGHSMGEYSAIFCAGMIDFEEVLWLVKRRAEVMEEENQKNPGAMAAVIGNDLDLALKIISSSGLDVYPANYNSADQLVISGRRDDVDKLFDELTHSGFRFIRLKVGVASHSPLMEELSVELGRALNSVNFVDPSIKVLSLTTLELFTKSNVRSLLEDQIKKPILFYQGIKKLISTDEEVRFIEVGPSNVLTRLINRISGRDLCIPVSGNKAADVINFFE